MKQFISQLPKAPNREFSGVLGMENIRFFAEDRDSLIQNLCKETLSSNFYLKESREDSQQFHHCHIYKGSLENEIITEVYGKSNRYEDLDGHWFEYYEDTRLVWRVYEQEGGCEVRCIASTARRGDTTERNVLKVLSSEKFRALCFTDFCREKKESGLTDDQINGAMKTEVFMKELVKFTFETAVELTKG